MSERYPGGIISQTPVVPTTSSAPGIWTLDQQEQAQQAGTWPSQPFNYIEDVFSTWLYTGTGATQTITNNIDLTKGGLTWIKSRSAATSNKLTDTVRGATKALISETTGPQTTDTTGLTAFGSTGFTIGADTNYNTSAATYASWTFRKQPKFFDIVTYTGTGANTTIPHNLGSVPGCIIVKRLDGSQNWAVYHNGLTSAAYSFFLNSNIAQTSSPTFWNSTAPTSSVFSVGTYSGSNASGASYVAYLFAHNAGGFGLTGTDNVISCGSWTASATDTITLGYEPQWLLVKDATSADNWYIVDNMRGFSLTGGQLLDPNLSNAETVLSANKLYPTATGFVHNSLFTAGDKIIYIAIRRGPMKVPTDATKVFNPNTYTGTVSSLTFPNLPDLSIQMARTSTGQLTEGWTQDRLRGVGGTYQNVIATTSTMQEESGSINGSITNFGLSQYSVAMQSNPQGNNSGVNYIDWIFSRAPGFFDEVCYTGDGTSALSLTHNLQAVPQLIIVKDRSNIKRWQVYSATTGASAYLILNTTAASTASSSMWNATTPTSTTFTVGDVGDTNVSGDNYVAYLFATCPGVSKVGSYTGTGATQTISCGFTGGARFVLVKRTNTTGDWYVWDTARGMVSGTDPSLLLNSTAAEVNANSIYTATGGFQIVSTAAGINASGSTYIFLAIA